MSIRSALVTLFAFAVPLAASAQYVGVTTDSWDGASGGPFYFNRACQADFSGSRMCSSEEILKTVSR